MGEVPPPDGLRVSHGQDVADNTVLEEQLAKQRVVRAVAQNVSNGENSLLAASNLVGLESCVHFDAILESGCQRLLAHDVQPAESGEGHDDFAVHLIQHADEGGVDAGGHITFAGFGPGPATCLVGDELTPVGEGGAFWRRRLCAPDHGLTKAVSLVVIWLCNRGDHAVG